MQKYFPIHRDVRFIESIFRENHSIGAESIVRYPLYTLSALERLHGTMK